MNIRSDSDGLILVKLKVKLHEEQAKGTSFHGTIITNLLGSKYNPVTGYQGLVPPREISKMVVDG